MGADGPGENWEIRVNEWLVEVGRNEIWVSVEIVGMMVSEIFAEIFGLAERFWRNELAAWDLWCVLLEKVKCARIERLDSEGTAI